MKNLLHISQKNVNFISFDSLAKAIYIGFTNNPIVSTDRKDKHLSFDYDKDGNIVGIEIIRISKAKLVLEHLVKDAKLGFTSAVRNNIEKCMEQVAS